jgi:uncharacterized membrane protein YeiH
VPSHDGKSIQTEKYFSHWRKTSPLKSILFYNELCRDGCSLARCETGKASRHAGRWQPNPAAVIEARAIWMGIDVRLSAATLVLVADLAGTFVFAVEGAIAAMRSNLDLLGLMVLAFATALCGGMTRDVLIGAVPPNAIRDWRYPAVAFTAGTLAFLTHALVRPYPQEVIVSLDAAGLALFAVAGTEKALAYGIHPLIAVLLGAITAVGGGVVRDVLLAQIPAVLRVDIYATAALAGSLFMVAGQRIGMPRTTAAILGGGVCFTLRMLAVWQNWQLPKANAF